jgi:hypothetical protein
MNGALGGLSASPISALAFSKGTRECFITPLQWEFFAIQLSFPSQSREVKRWHSGSLFKWVIFLYLSSQEKQLVKLMQCTVTNALEMPKAQQT